MSAQRADTILQFIRDYIDREAMAPSVREICEGCGIRSTSTVHRYLHRLETDGRIRLSTGKNRAIVVTDSTSDTTLGIPVLGTLGEPGVSGEKHPVREFFDPDFRKQFDNNLFALQIRGSSMKELGFQNGDILIAEQTSAARKGDTVVVLLGGRETALRTFTGTEPLAQEDAAVIGRVVSMIRYF